MRGLYIVGALILGGCSGYVPASEIVISPEFSPGQIELIASAADEWCKMAGACVPVSVGVPANVLVRPANECEGPSAGTTLLSGAEPTVKLCVNRSDRFFAVLAAHEIGHALFALDEHTPEPGNVMSAGWSEQSPTPTDADVALVTRR